MRLVRHPVGRSPTKQVGFMEISENAQPQNLHDSNQSEDQCREETCKKEEEGDHMF